MNLDSEQVTIFLISISLLLIFSRLFGEIFIKLNQPAVVGEILAGVILGPTVFGMIAPSYHEIIFPDFGPLKTALEGLTTISVVLLLLSSGMEVDLSTVIRNRKVSLIVSAFGILTPFILSFSFAYYFPQLLGAEDSHTQLSFALFIGIALSISALPVIAKILLDLNIFKTQVGNIIISSAMLIDLLGWLMFSFLLGFLGIAERHFNLNVTVMLIAGFIILVLFPVRILFDKSIKFIQSKFSFPSTTLNFIIILGFLGAAFTEYIGVHAILGVFLIGIAIGDSVHLKEQTKSSLNQFIINIFAPLFFASIGLRVNFISNFDLVAVFMVMLLASSGTIIGASLGARLGGINKIDSLSIAFGLNARGAMEIILGIIALDVGLIGESTFVALVVMALVTSMVSAPLMSRFISNENLFSLSNLIKKTSVIKSTKKNKNDVIKELVEAIDIKINNNEILSDVLRREVLTPTGIANYLAIPHAKMNIKKPILVIARNNFGVDFQAADNLPAKIIFLLLTPADNPELQLTLLAEIAKKFSDREKVEDLLEIKDDADFIERLKSL